MEFFINKSNDKNYWGVLNIPNFLDPRRCLLSANSISSVSEAYLRWFIPAGWSLLRYLRLKYIVYTELKYS